MSLMPRFLFDPPGHDIAGIGTSVKIDMSPTCVHYLQGDADKFYKENQLLPENFEQACKSAGMPIDMRIQPGYDHSYFFIASFVEDHIQHHAKALSV